MRPRAPSRWDTFGYQLGLVGFTRLSNIVRMGRQLLRVHPRYMPRGLLLITASALSAPLRVLETLCCWRRIAAVQIAEPPIFIIGHWRSGTTHLHNLMTQDPELGHVSMYQAAIPDGSLIAPRWLRRLLAQVVPSARPMDNMVWPMDSPQEDEIPLAKTVPFSFYHHFSFPNETRRLFHDYVLFNGVSARVIREFKEKYLRVLRIATLHADGRRLVLKNPVNTGRIRVLLEMFPDAKFVHIHRNPYDVFMSTKSMLGKLHSMITLQEIDARRSDETVLYLYEQMMQRFLTERSLIPKGNLVEVRYEDLERNPLAELARVYDELDLTRFDALRPALEAYLDSLAGYRKNRFDLSTKDREKVERHWGFAFSCFGYARRAK